MDVQSLDVWGDPLPHRADAASRRRPPRRREPRPHLWWLAITAVLAGGCRDAVTGVGPSAEPGASVAAAAAGDTVRIVTFGDSNTDWGIQGTTTTVKAYVSHAPLALAPGAPNSPLQLAGKIERLWGQMRPEPVEAVNHAIGGTTSGGGAFSSSRTSVGAPNARTPVNGITRYEAEVLGSGAPSWNGGEPVNASYPGGPITRVKAHAPDERSFAYVSMGTNDVYTSVTAAAIAQNLAWMIDRWVTATGAPRRFILTTIPPVAKATVLEKVAALNDSIRALGGRKGVRVVDLAAHTSADNGRTWRSADLHVGDQVHYTEAVREWIAQQVVLYMDSVLATAPPPGGAPTASFTVSGAPPRYEGSSLTFDASGSTDPTAEPLAYHWAFGDGATATGAVVSHTYADNGAYGVVLTVRDPGGLEDQALRTVDVANALPVVGAGPDAQAVTGQRFNLAAAFSDAGAGDAAWKYTVAWGDGTTSSGSRTAQGALTGPYHVYASAGTRTVRVTVTDKDGGAGWDETTLTVAANAPPVAAIGGPYAGSEGTAVAFSSAGSSDPNGDALKYGWSFGDGGTSTAAGPSRTYADDGTYTVRLVVTDPSGAADTATTTATVANVAPTGSLSAPSSITEGSGYTVAFASSTDKGSVDRATLEHALDCGLGAGFSAWSTTVKSLACPVQPDQRTAITVRGRVRDKDGGQTEYTRTVSVRNAAPVVSLSAVSATTFPRGGSLSVRGSFTDAGTMDGPWTYTFAWGDGTPATTGSAGAQGGPLAASHAFASAGTYGVTLSVRDKEGATGRSTTLTVTVQ